MSVKLKVYLESSFVSYVTGMATSNAKIAADQAYTRQWWEEERSACDVYTSNYTVQESVDGRQDQVALRLEFLKSVPLLPSRIEEEVALANKLIAGHALPEGETTDALHIAAASVAGMDILLTWNCRHMANPHTLPLTRDIVTKAGYVCPAVMTPKTFIENKMMEDCDV
ncbi:MAG: type II toxin-antitoxin system VapC family toxin [Kiritimatiellae bacterium]|nr:type II toxin-antitoxin system VapC family toxin [Kiritimatiellia bacterium]